MAINCGNTLKIATWNVNSLKVRLPQVLDWLDQSDCDVLALQETKTEDQHFPLDAIQAAGFDSVYIGQKTYNGVAIIAKHGIPLKDVVYGVPGFDDPQQRVIAATVNNVRVIDLYVVNGAEVGSEKFDYKLRWLEQVTAYIAKARQDYEHVVVLGDFNIAPADADVHDPEEWRGKILFSEQEHAALDKIKALGFSDVFRQFDQPEQLFSWWDYRAAGFRRNRGLRIDLILASTALAEHCKACEIDKTPRGWERPSDHTPVWAQFELAD